MPRNAMCALVLSSRAKGIVTAVSVLVFAFVLVAPLAVSSDAATCTVDAYGGRAYGLWLHTPVSETTYADTGDLPPDGGSSDSTVDWTGTPAAEATAFFSLTTASDGVAQSFVSASGVTLIPGEVPLVTASSVSAKSEATCDGVSGSSTVADLRVLGTPVTVTGEVNQMVFVPGVFTLVINEQHVSTETSNSVTVNALHLWAQGVEIVVASAHSEVVPAVVVPVA